MEHETLINAIVVFLVFLVSFTFNVAGVIVIYEIDRKRKK